MPVFFVWTIIKSAVFILMQCPSNAFKKASSKCEFFLRLQCVMILPIRNTQVRMNSSNIAPFD